MSSLYSIILVCLEILFFSISAFILFRTYSHTKYLAHVFQATSFCILLFNGILRFVTSFFPEEIVIFESSGGFSLSMVSLLWALMNTSLIVGIYLLLLSFFYVKMNSIHPFLNVVSLLIGATILAFGYPTFTTLTFDPLTSSWNATYDIIVMLLIGPLLLLFIISIIIPVVTKVRKSSFREQRIQMIIQIVGLSLVLIWSFLAAFTNNYHITLLRPFLLPLGWIVWSTTLLIDPFNIMVSNAKINQIYIATEEGLPFYFKDFEGTQNISSTLAATIISGVKSALEELVQRKDKLSVLNYEKQVLGIVSVGHLTAFVFGERLDRTLETVLRFLLQSIQKNPLVMLQLSQKIVAFDEESSSEIVNAIENSLKSVLTI